jgi:hypothetical protein
MSDAKPGARPDEPEEDGHHEPAQGAEPPAHDVASSHELPPEQRVRINDAPGPRALPPHAAAHGVVDERYTDFARSARRGRFKLAVVSSFALTVVFLELLWLAPGVGIAFGLLAAPLMVYLLRITRTYMEGESGFRRGMANTGSIIITILGALLFMFVSFATIFWIICGRAPIH